MAATAPTGFVSFSVGALKVDPSSFGVGCRSVTSASASSEPALGAVDVVELSLFDSRGPDKPSIVDDSGISRFEPVSASPVLTTTPVPVRWSDRPALSGADAVELPALDGKPNELCVDAVAPGPPLVAVLLVAAPPGVEIEFDDGPEPSEDDPPESG